MLRNPFVNAVLAAVYIVFIVLLIQSFQYLLGDTGKPDTILAPITMLSLFVLSTGVMLFLSVYEPVRLLIEGKKNEATTFFLKELLTFACFVILFVILLVYTG